MKEFPASVPVRTLGDADNRRPQNVEFLKRCEGGAAMPCPSINQQEIRPVALASVWILALKSLEAPRQHLPHHRVVIARGCRSDVEATIRRLHEAIRPGDDKCPYWKGPLQVTVVIDFYSPRRLREAKYLRQTVQHFQLIRALRNTASQCGLCVVLSGTHRLPFFAALGNEDRNTPSNLYGERFGQQRHVGNALIQ